MASVSEAVIIKLLRSGSEKAFSMAYEMYAQRLLSFCFSYTKTKADAEEIVQDTFLKLWITRENIKNDNSLKPLLFTIARRKLVDFYRRRVNSISFEDYLIYKDCLQEQDNQMEYEQYLECVKKSVNLLTPVQKKVFVMSKFEGASIPDIAHRLSITEKTVRNQLSLGSKRVYSAVLQILRSFVFFCMFQP